VSGVSEQEKKVRHPPGESFFRATLRKSQGFLLFLDTEGAPEEIVAWAFGFDTQGFFRPESSSGPRQNAPL